MALAASMQRGLGSTRALASPYWRPRQLSVRRDCSLNGESRLDAWKVPGERAGHST
jgi:hypothetical protein